MFILYVQLTRCVPPSETGEELSNLYSNFDSGMAGALVGTLSGAAVGIPLGYVNPLLAFGLGLAVGGCAAIRTWQYFYNNRRLICVAKDQCLIGTVTHISTPPAGLQSLYKVDNDYSFELMPLPHQPEEIRDVVASDGYLGTQFVGDPTSITGLGLASSGPTPDHPTGTNTLHCEIEGNGPDVLADAICLISFIAGAAIAGVSFACAFLGPLICFLVVLAIILVALAAAAAALSLLSHDGTPADVADDANSESLNVGDYFLVKGEHVYEGGHLPATWPEMHPVKEIHKLNDLSQEIGELIKAYNSGDITAIDRTKDFVNSWCNATGKIKDPGVILAQANPANQWIDHPLVDGCTPQIVIE